MIKLNGKPMLKCEHCIHKKICIDEANYRNAERCGNFINENDIAHMKYGRWECDEHFARCSECETEFYICDLEEISGCDLVKYCPNCGAKMDNESEEK